MTFIEALMKWRLSSPKTLSAQSPEYSQIAEEEKILYSDNENGLKVETSHLRPVIPQKNRSSAIWFALTFTLGGLALYFFVQNLQMRRLGSFHTGYANDMSLAIPAIQVSQVRFTGGMKFDDNGTIFRDIIAGKQYVGLPSPEIDANWRALIDTQYLAFTEEQRPSVQVHMTKDEDEGVYRVGPDVFHSLHCIDLLRRTINGYLYAIPKEIADSRLKVLHLEHCVDFLRQLVQCTSDLTPIPLVHSKGAGVAIPDFEQVHTCRNFDLIRDWAENQNTVALETVKNGM